MDQIILKELGEDDLPSIQGVFEACEDYFVTTTGGPATPAAAHALYIQLPEGKTYDDKHILGVCGAGTPELIGVIDAILDCPEPDVAMLGLFLIVPEHRRRGMGKKAYASLEQWIKDQGGSAIQVSIYEGIEDDTSFWKQAGFRSTGQRLDDGIHVLAVLEKVLVRTRG